MVCWSGWRWCRWVPHGYRLFGYSMDVTHRKEGVEMGVLESDRTKLFDMLAGEIANQKVRFYQPFKELQGRDGKGLVYHVGNMYRIVEKDSKGIDKAKWERVLAQSDDGSVGNST